MPLRAGCKPFPRFPKSTLPRCIAGCRTAHARTMAAPVFGRVSVVPGRAICATLFSSSSRSPAPCYMQQHGRHGGHACMGGKRKSVVIRGLGLSHNWRNCSCRRQARLSWPSASCGELLGATAGAAARHCCSFPARRLTHLLLDFSVINPVFECQSAAFQVPGGLQQERSVHGRPCSCYERGRFCSTSPATSCPQLCARHRQQITWS
jgi:hypothetical protein